MIMVIISNFLVQHCDWLNVKKSRKSTYRDGIMRFNFGTGNFCQEDLKIGLAAVFDGHGGNEASELAVQLFPFYFQLHVIFLGQKEMELFEDKQDMAFQLETEANPLGAHFGRCISTIL